MAGISITLAGNFSKLDELKGKANSAAKSIKASFKNVAGSAAFQGLAVGATAAFAGVTAAMAKSVEKGGELHDMMLRTGASGKGLVILQKAFENAGVSGDKLPGTLNKMQKALAGVNEEGEPTVQAFDKLGLSIAELQSLDPVDAFKKTAQAIAELPDPSHRAAAAMEIFGRAGGELLAVMNDPAAFSQARDQVGSLADMLPGAAGDFDNIGDALASFDEKVQQLGTSIAIGLLPTLSQMVELLNAVDLGKLPGFLDFRLQNPFGQNGLQNPLTVSKKYLTPDQGEAEQWAADWASDDPMHGKSRAEVEAGKLAADNADFWQRKEKEKQDAITKTANAERKKAEATKESRAAAMAEYNLESAMISARLRGDAARLEALEREKAIREEIKRLESAGFTNQEARKPAEAKVDAAKKADDKEAARKAAQESRANLQNILAGKVNDSRAKLDALQYQSSVGAISSMQRVGGGGGAVSSGLDYQRQASDHLRELNQAMRELIQVSRQPLD